MTTNIFAEGILTKKVAFVTGGGTGITGGVARALAEAGASVALVSRKLEHLEPAAESINANGGEAIAVAADVRDPEAVDKALANTVERLGKIDIVVMERRETSSAQRKSFHQMALGLWSISI